MQKRYAVPYQPLIWVVTNSANGWRWQPISGAWTQWTRCLSSMLTSIGGTRTVRRLLASHARTTNSTLLSCCINTGRISTASFLVEGPRLIGPCATPAQRFGNGWKRLVARGTATTKNGPGHHRMVNAQPDTIQSFPPGKVEPCRAHEAGLAVFLQWIVVTSRSVTALVRLV